MQDTKFKHTPGPWEISPDNNWETGINTPSDSHFIQVTNSDMEGFDEMYANAKLIAAAPDMLDELMIERRVKDLMTDACKWLSKHHNNLPAGHSVEAWIENVMLSVNARSKQLDNVIAKATGKEVGHE